MANIERMTVVFPEPMADQIRSAVEKGEYASTSEAVRDAVRLWTDQRELKSREREVFRKAWDAGKKSGVAGPFAIRDIIREAKAEKPKVKRKAR